MAALAAASRCVDWFVNWYIARCHRMDVRERRRRRERALRRQQRRVCWSRLVGR